ncbi:putative Serpin family protein [Medicago truncatula]|uniref:Putative Serpin family protein n=1 Tax=Medicago truncatula TaxID=3880 RepID=A0A396IKF1_MEDTR|nr:putative Serpin family protein [Medicago truncatula]
MAHCESKPEEKRMILESITNQTKVSLRIAKYLFSKESEKNIVFSPLSLQVALSMIAAGSDGPTREQLLDFLLSKSTDHLNSFASHLVSAIISNAAPSGGPCLSFLNGVWVDQSRSLQPSFQQIVSNDYKATLSSVDFKNKATEVLQEVNLWAEKETNGLIKNLLPPGSVDDLVVLIGANALYFKGTWEEQFDIEDTEDYVFHVQNGNSQGGGKRRFSFYLFLPDAEDGLLDLIEKLASEFEYLQHKLPSRKVKVGAFRIPRFNISFELETSSVLKELGVVLPFSDIGGVAKTVAGESLVVSKIFHKSFIEVNEAGTEAAAATAFIEAEYGMSEVEDDTSKIEFVADHPFLFLIREDLSGTVLFIGQVLNPLDM